MGTVTRPPSSLTLSERSYAWPGAGVDSPSQLYGIQEVHHHSQGVDLRVPALEAELRTPPLFPLLASPSPRSSSAPGLCVCGPWWI